MLKSCSLVEQTQHCVCRGTFEMLHQPSIRLTVQQGEKNTNWCATSKPLVSHYRSSIYNVCTATVYTV